MKLWPSLQKWSYKNRFLIAILEQMRITCLIVLGKTLRPAGSSSLDLTLLQKNGYIYI